MTSSTNRMTTADAKVELVAKVLKREFYAAVDSGTNTDGFIPIARAVLDALETTCSGCWHLGEACGHCSVCTPTGVTRPSYIGPPCATCGAAHPFDNVFCSDGFHAPPDATPIAPVQDDE